MGVLEGHFGQRLWLPGIGDAGGKNPQAGLRSSYITGKQHADLLNSLKSP
jgi:hypothetical protein